LREFSGDYHVVAVDLRGYGDTDHPPSVSDYFITNLTRDVVELIRALGHEKAIVVSHDWGAIIAWIVAQYHPEVVEKLVVLDGPHPLVMARNLSIVQLVMSWYVLFFQVPWLPEFGLSLNDYGNLDEVFYGSPFGVRNKKNFTSDHVEAYKYIFSQDGALTPPLNYYRANALRLGDYLSSNPGDVIELPILVIWGDDDCYLNSDLADRHRGVARNVMVKHIKNCSHWVQNDQPEEVNQCIREFLS
jgi:pimeloyl-ACP methyl ester carboxylesterase